MKYLIAPSYKIGDFWAREMELRRNEYKIITNREESRSYKLKASEVIFVEEEPFDYPSTNSEEWYRLLEELPYRIEMDI